MSVEFAGSAYSISKYDAKGEVVWSTAIFRPGPRTIYTCDVKNALKGVNVEGCRFEDLNFGAVRGVGLGKVEGGKWKAEEPRM
jgi:hypothetical protein